MKVRLPRLSVIVAIASAFLVALVLPLGIAAASTTDLTPGPAYTVWAYGVVKTVDFSGTLGKGYGYEGSATYGYSVVLTQTNLSSTNFELQVNRTMGALLSVTYCYPNCKNPSATGTIFHHAWESDDVWANFTTNGTVLDDGRLVPAIALLNSHTMVNGSLLDTAQGAVRMAYLSANVSANANVVFATPLGLLPDNLTAPMNWNSSAAFTASGGYSLEYGYRYTGPHLKEVIGPVTQAADVNRSGDVTVLGSTQAGPGGTVSFGGVSFLNVSLNVEGPFVAREGFILVPEPIDLFGSSTAGPVSGNESGGASAQMTSLYVQPGVTSHLGIGGSEWVYAASAVNPTDVSVSSASGSLDQVSSGADSLASTPVQGTPIPVDQAQGDGGCLVTGASCPSAASPRALLPGFTLGVVLVVIVAVLAVVVLTERRRMPPPTYPNAKLYPPGDPTTAKPLDSSRSPATRKLPPSSDDEDPLSNLW
ncbi:MAG: hypothetical protein WB947_00540 [Thermoplasmata archaeon]